MDGYLARSKKELLPSLIITGAWGFWVWVLVIEAITIIFTVAWYAKWLNRTLNFPFS